jgi:prevent-host-death family protein
MREIGVRELKASLGATLRAVARGERVRVTVRGKHVADLVPAGSPPDDERIRELAVAGRIVLPSRPQPETAPRLARGRTSATDEVLADRDAER